MVMLTWGRSFLEIPNRKTKSGGGKHRLWITQIMEMQVHSGRNDYRGGDKTS